MSIKELLTSELGETYTTGTGQKLKVHDKSKCAGNPCPIHNPTNHPMKDFPTHWRDDRRIMERICPHGIGHPDPDDYRIRNGEDQGIHGCDGCCTEDYPIRSGVASEPVKITVDKKLSDSFTPGPAFIGYLLELDNKNSRSDW